MHLSRKPSELERFLRNFWLKGYLEGPLATFPINCFPAFFCGHLEFLHKIFKNAFISITMRDRVILANFLTRRVSAACYRLSQKIVFPTIFGVKCKSTFGSETVWHRSILTKFFDPQGIGSLMATFPKNRFPAIFDAHLEFLNKRKKNKRLTDAPKGRLCRQQ